MTGTFAIIGQLRSEGKVFKDLSGDVAGQLQLRADIEYRGQEHKDVIFLMLNIQGSVDSGWRIHDDAPPFLPFLKPVKAFRTYLIGELKRIRSELPEKSQRSPTCPLWMGIGNYMRELDNFSEARSLAAQLRSVADVIQRDLKFNENQNAGPAIKKMKAAFKIFGVVPRTEQPFEIM